MRLMVVLLVLGMMFAGGFQSGSAQGGCGQCATGAQTAGNIAFNACRDAGESDEVAACCSSTAKLNYAYSNCPGCTELIAFLIEHDTCMD